MSSPFAIDATQRDAAKALGNDVYDQIMAEIEPELTTASIPLLDEKYKDETPEQAEERAQRYNRAFAAFHVKLQENQAQWISQFERLRREAMVTMEKDDRTQEQGDLSTLEQTISSQ